MYLADLIHLFGKPRILPDSPSLAITGIQFDSRKVEAGNVFVAMQGGNIDGHAFIPAAIQKGAVAVIGTEDVELGKTPYFRVTDAREALARLSAAFYEYPARQLTVIGVTGTDGKTTTVSLIYAMLLAAGLKAGMISTVDAVIGSEEIDTGFHVTTPDAPTIQMLLRRMVDNGLTHVVLETTSHGLAQHRTTACDYDIGVITNITHEHLDYHGDYAHYLAAKSKLLTGLIDTPVKAGHQYRLAVLNHDDISYLPLKAILADSRYAGVRQISYGSGEENDLRGRDLQVNPEGIRFAIDWHGRTWQVESNLVGAYNMQNILAAVGATVAGLGLPMETALRGVGNLHGVPGRMERIDLGQDFTAIVDFAHTPNALKVTLETANRMKGKGRIIAVFGSAGLRDREKRRMMAATSVELADLTILTAEIREPKAWTAFWRRWRTRQPGTEVRRTDLYRVPDRGDAIRKAIALAGAGDIVISCGKGHEQSMCFGETISLGRPHSYARRAG
jgi:UDP-N-acetylmuramoyl-L-alanyl-D-glutamate--2,6-diaminopimelate ligase